MLQISHDQHLMELSKVSKEKQECSKQQKKTVNSQKSQRLGQRIQELELRENTNTILIKECTTRIHRLESQLIGM